MALYVNTNVSSLNAQRMLDLNGAGIDQSFKRLASGYRINTASDDAAGMQIAERMTSQINGFQQGNRNANDGISIAQTTEGAMVETNNMLQRMRVLALQSANGSVTDKDRVAIQNEIKQMGEEINRVAIDTEFAGQKVLDGNYSGTFQVGAKANQTIDFSMTSIKSAKGELVAVEGGFTISGMATVASAVSGEIKGVSKVFKSAATLSVSSQSNAQSMLRTVDAMLEVVNTKRSELGAVQNRMSSTIRNQSNITENLSASRSRIMDADYAAEASSLVQGQVRQQASSAILSQANQKSQQALSLLR